MIHVLIADDQPIVRIGLTYLLSKEVDIHISGEANNSEELFEQLPKLPVDLLIISLSLAAKDGYHVLEQLRLRHSECPVLVLSRYSEPHHALPVIGRGATGYLDKMAIPTQLVKAVRNVSSGKRYINDACAKELAFLNQTTNNAPQHETLSKRELQILCMLVSNRTQKEISQKLNISQKTVSTHKSRILEKLNLTSTGELIRYAIENNLYGN